MKRVVTESIREIDKAPGAGAKRLGEMQRFYRYAIRHTDLLIKGWQDERRKR
ncbi:MAG: hypothetical protein ABIY46_18800 [Gemmatimonadales bacterium]